MALHSDLCRGRSIAVVGFMAAGKTTIGQRLAERLRLPFVDTDRELEATFGCSVAEIFASRGEGEFRTAERELVIRLLGGDARILSLGGGAYLDPELRATLSASATTVWLDPPFELIIDRLALSAGRPLASGKSSDELRRLWMERRKGYAEADIHLVTRDDDPGEIVDQILERLSADLDVEPGFDGTDRSSS